MGFLEKKVYSEFLENAIIEDFYSSYIKINHERMTAEVEDKHR